MMAKYYMCSEGEIMAAALFAHFKLGSETIVVFNDEYGEDFTHLDHDEYIVAEALLIRKELNCRKYSRCWIHQYRIPGHQTADR